jgi:membrane associated rhomboid family serine protease
MRTLMSRTIAISAAAAIALTTFGLQPAAAHPRDGDAAALGAFAAIFGTIAAIIAAEQYRDRTTYVPSYTYGPVYGGPVHRPYGHWRHPHPWQPHHHR